VSRAGVPADPEPERSARAHGIDLTRRSTDCREHWLLLVGERVRWEDAGCPSGWLERGQETTISPRPMKPMIRRSPGSAFGTRRRTSRDGRGLGETRSGP
jgi:hypothetical protein